ncbi:MAG: ATP-binding protein [bacterium]|nr:ATP-binding protein [bacterium]
MKKTELVVLVGLPGSGKSTYARKMRECGYQVHSSDEIRRELFGDEEIQKKKDKVFGILIKRVGENLEQGKSCVVDATNLGRKKRMFVLANVQEIPCRKICVLFVTPVDICRRRNAARRRRVTDEVFDKMLRAFECPGYYEGWDEIRPVFCQEKYRIPIEQAENFSQDNPHHSLTLGQHMEAARKYCEEHGYSEMLQQVAEYHDCGKLYTKQFCNKKGEVTETAHYYGHENYGAYLYLTHCCSEGKLKYPTWEDTLYAVQLINWHMRPLGVWRNSKKAQARDQRLLGEAFYEDLMKLHEADRAAH